MQILLPRALVRWSIGIKPWHARHIRACYGSPIPSICSNKQKPSKNRGETRRNSKKIYLQVINWTIFSTILIPNPKPAKIYKRCMVQPCYSLRAGPPRSSSGPPSKEPGTFSRCLIASTPVKLFPVPGGPGGSWWQLAPAMCRLQFSPDNVELGLIKLSQLINPCGAGQFLQFKNSWTPPVNKPTD